MEREALSTWNTVFVPETTNHMVPLTIEQRRIALERYTEEAIRVFQREGKFKQAVETLRQKFSALCSTSELGTYPFVTKISLVYVRRRAFKFQVVSRRAN